MGSETNFSLIWAVVKGIPRGRVMTYGQVAAAAGFTHGARLAGRAMHVAKGIPWHRVVAAAGKGLGRIAVRDPATRDRQRALLKREGVRVSPAGLIDLDAFGVV